MKVKIIKKLELVHTSIVSERVFKSHKTQKLNRVIEECFLLSCGCEVPTRFINKTKTNYVSCPRCRWK